MTTLKKYNISFNPAGKSATVLAGTNIMDAARSAGINLAASCGGKGHCGQCRVIITKGDVSSPLKNEEKFLSPGDKAEGYRLACRTFPESDIKVLIPEKSLVNDLKLQLEGEETGYEIDPVIKSCDVTVSPPGLADPVSDLKRIIKSLKESHNITGVSADVMAVRQLPLLLRKNNWETTVYLRDSEIIGFMPKGSPPAGLAVDLGTTKVAAYLMDLTTGMELVSQGSINPQSPYGDDVMSRLDRALHDGDKKDAGSPKLHGVIRDLLNGIIETLTRKAGLTGNNVADICIVGNTAMTHLFLGLPVEQLAKSPYVAATDFHMDIKARDVGISACPGAYIHLLPGIGGFVGADHVSMIIGAGIDKKDKITLGVDIGTNTEIVLNNPEIDSLVSLSCPSGPAFEGAHVTDGMKAARGAIEAVRITEENVEFRTIGDAPPIGLCGSGIIDAVAELYRWGIISERGRFDRDNKSVNQGKHGSEFVIAGSNNGNGRIVISQKDIAEIQLAKGAIKAGIEALMEVNHVTEDMVEEVIIAGAFGSYINLVNAVDIGLFPAFPNARYLQVGNSAGTGAKMTLVSGRERERARNIALKTLYLELTTHRNFNQRFAEGMRFPPVQPAAKNKDYCTKKGK